MGPELMGPDPISDQNLGKRQFRSKPYWSFLGEVHFDCCPCQDLGATIFLGIHNMPGRTLLGRNRISTEAQAGIRQGWKAEKRDLIGSDSNNCRITNDLYDYRTFILAVAATAHFNASLVTLSPNYLSITTWVNYYSHKNCC